MLPNTNAPGLATLRSQTGERTCIKAEPYDAKGPRTRARGYCKKERVKPLGGGSSPMTGSPPRHNA